MSENTTTTEVTELNPTEQLKEIAYSGHKVLVEAAKRDGLGRHIDETYVEKGKIQNFLKTINNTSIVGTGNLDLSGFFKTVNNQSLFGTGNLDLSQILKANTVAELEELAAGTTNVGKYVQYLGETTTAYEKYCLYYIAEDLT